MTPDQEEALRLLLHNRPMTFPVLIHGLLGGDPNDFTLKEQICIGRWLRALGYERRLRPEFRHAHLMSVYVREELWAGEEPGPPRPYDGIPLKRDPELRDTREERADRKCRRRRFHAYLRGDTGGGLPD